MASSGFPQRKSQGSGGMTSAGPGSAGPLDGPPPSPVMAQASPAPGMGAQMGGALDPNALPSFAQMAQPMTAGSPGRALSPEMAMGIMQTAEMIYGILDSMSSIVPDLANDFVLQKDLLQRTMGKLLLKSGQSGTPTSVGPNFPGGGFTTGAQ